MTEDGATTAISTTLGYNSSFSQSNPNLQLAIDSTSLGEFKKCPRSYQYSIIQGWTLRDTSVHLEFGIWFHGATERYDHARARGEGHQQAVRIAVQWAMEQTWDKTLRRGWISNHPNKTRLSLIRSIVWYLEEFGENDLLSTVQLANGKPAVELSFSFFSGRKTWSSGEDQFICGHIDRVVEMNGDLFISDKKTTSGQLGPKFFLGFSPSNQMSTYTTAGYVALDIPVRGVIIDGVQVGVNFTRFERGLTQRNKAQMDEWLEGTISWLDQMEECAVTGQWPMNDKSCDMYGGCQFREVCSRPPGARHQWLKMNYEKRVWDPLVRRGDI